MDTGRKIKELKLIGSYQIKRQTDRQTERQTDIHWEYQ